MYLVTGVLILFLLVVFVIKRNDTTYYGDEKPWSYAFLAASVLFAFLFLVFAAIFLIGYQIYLL